VFYPDQILANRYRLIGLVGQGTMGAVYSADDLLLVRRVALKHLHYAPEASEKIVAQTRHQFEREARILATLNHPNLPRVTDYFELTGQQFLVMDYIEGQSLDEILALYPAGLSEELVLDWADQLLSALEYIHRHGLVHRDVKPANIRVTPDGRVYLVDFGLVKAFDPHSPKTATAMRGLGTPQYAPPEQYDAEIGHTEPRSDVYALGATLYHLLTGVPPATVTQRVSNPNNFRPVRELNPAVSLEVERVILRAMEVPIDKRFASVGDMRAALRLAHPRAVADPGGTMPLAAHGLTGYRRVINRRMWGSVGLLVMLGVILTTVFVVGPTLTPTPTPTSTASPTSIGADALPFNTSVSPTATATLIPPTLTRTATRTPSATSVASKTRTSTPSPTRTPTSTIRRPTSTPTAFPPTETFTREPPLPATNTPTWPPPTYTYTPEPPTETFTPEPPTVPPTLGPEPTG
jgi:serine/threonine-protein kinase